MEEAKKCFKFWTNQGTDCSICIRICPYNRDYSKWYHRWWRKLAGTGLRRLALWLDDKLVIDDWTWHAPKENAHVVEFSERQGRIRDAILEICRAEPFAPPTPGDFAKRLGEPADRVDAVHESLVASGDLVDGEVCGFHPDAVAEAWERLEGHRVADRQPQHVEAHEASSQERLQGAP